MRYYITFGDEKYEKTKNFSAMMAKIFGGFDYVIAYSPSDIDEEYKNTHKDIFNIKRGYGLWLWKPYIIYKTLTEVCKDGDFLFYGDGGSFFFRNIKYIENSMGTDKIWVSHNSLVEWQFTKKDVFDLMNCHGTNYENTAQAQGGFMYLIKSDDTLKFVKDWLNLCENMLLLHPDNLYSKEQNVPGFISHREDQSILSLLCKKNHIKLHQDPTQFGKYPEKYWQEGIIRVDDSYMLEYPVCIILHRTACLDINTILRQLILTIIPRKWGLHMISYNKT